MKSKMLCSLFSCIVVNAFTQNYYGSFSAGGTSNNYYPVLFSVSGVDGNSSLGKLSVYIDNVHANGSWSGSFHSDIEFISSNWGHMNTNIVEFTYVSGNGYYYNDPIGDIADGSTLGGGSQMVIWLKGGATYQWSTTLNSRVVLMDGNSAGSSKINASGATLNILTSQSQLVAAAKNNRYLQSIGFGTAGNGYFGGNVGIGTTNPAEKLSVNGNIRSKKLIVTQTGWTDYVFDSSYQLQSLTEVEQFIKTNRHLPDVPSAKEVEKEGLNVGDNQAVLLKKIEELTLYMIEMKKDNEVMKKEIQALQKGKCPTGNNH